MSGLWKEGMERRDEWLAQVQEDIIDPGREIVDPHHHLWDRGGPGYQLEDLRSDTGSGHNVVQTVFIECRSFYDRSLPKPFQPVGETAEVARIAAEGAKEPNKAQIAGIVAHADLREKELGKILEAHEAAGNGLLVGIRHSGALDTETEAHAIIGRGVEGQYADPGFRRGLALLGERGLPYDTWHYHHQAGDFLDLVRAVPQTTIVLDHFSTPLGVGRFKGQRDAIFEQWKADMAALADCANVRAKLGGLAMPDNGWGWKDDPKPPTSDEIVEAQQAWYHHMIGLFGPERCMFESNFPVDRTAVGYAVLWNAFKKMADSYDATARDRMFAGTAREVYGLGPA